MVESKWAYKPQDPEVTLHHASSASALLVYYFTTLMWSMLVDISSTEKHFIIKQCDTDSSHEYFYFLYFKYVLFVVAFVTFTLKRCIF